MFKRAAASFWILLALSPVLRFLSNGVDERTVVCVLAYLAGGWLLWRCVCRDPNAEELRYFLNSMPGRLAVGLTVVLLVLVGFGVSLAAMRDAFLLECATLLVLWEKCRSGAALARAVGRVLLVVISLGLFFLMGEAIFRLPWLAARTGGRVSHLVRQAEKNYDYLWHKNPLEIRSLHFENPKPPGVLRIVTLGDSFTWGLFVARTEDTWPYVVERSLETNVPHVQVINLSQCGYHRQRSGEIGPPGLVIRSGLCDPSVHPE